MNRDPGWYRDPDRTDQVRWWDGSDWAVNVSQFPYYALAGETFNATEIAQIQRDVRQPRIQSLRALLTVLLLLGVYLLEFIVIVVAAWMGAESEVALNAIGALVVLVAYAWLATKVSYRWFDCFFLLIPIYGLIWTIKIAWKVASLPYRDWAPRPEPI